MNSRLPCTSLRSSMKLKLQHSTRRRVGTGTLRTEKRIMKSLKRSILARCYNPAFKPVIIHIHVKLFAEKCWKKNSFLTRILKENVWNNTSSFVISICFFYFQLKERLGSNQNSLDDENTSWVWNSCCWIVNFYVSRLTFQRSSPRTPCHRRSRGYWEGSLA